MIDLEVAKPFLPRDGTIRVCFLAWDPKGYVGHRRNYRDGVAGSPRYMDHSLINKNAEVWTGAVRKQACKGEYAHYGEV